MELSLQRLIVGLMVQRAAIPLPQELPVLSTKEQWRGEIVFGYLELLHHTRHKYCFFIYYFNICRSISVVQERNPKSPRNGLVTSPDPYSLLPSCCAAPEVSTTSKLNSNQPRKTKSRKGQRRKTFTYSHLSWTKKRESGTSDIESSSEVFVLTCLIQDYS